MIIVVLIGNSTFKELVKGVRRVQLRWSPIERSVTLPFSLGPENAMFSPQWQSPRQSAVSETPMQCSSETPKRVGRPLASFCRCPSAGGHSNQSIIEDDFGTLERLLEKEEHRLDWEYRHSALRGPRAGA
ncbi:hypothetical protein IF803_28850 [Bradyrhizobium sp. UFLA06-06]